MCAQEHSTAFKWLFLNQSDYLVMHNKISQSLNWMEWIFSHREWEKGRMFWWELSNIYALTWKLKWSLTPFSQKQNYTIHVLTEIKTSNRNAWSETSTKLNKYYILHLLAVPFGLELVASASPTVRSHTYLSNGGKNWFKWNIFATQLSLTKTIALEQAVPTVPIAHEEKII